jgi:hypothetical protein
MPQKTRKVIEQKGKYFFDLRSCLDDRIFKSPQLRIEG